MLDDKPRSFTSRLRSREIMLIRGKDTTGRPAWYYIQVDPRKAILFRKDLKSGQIQLTDYGKVVISGYGDDPPPSVQQRMKDEYDFDS